MLGMVLVVSCIKRFQVVGVISDKYWNVATMFHQVLLVLCLKVTTPLQKGSRYSQSGLLEAESLRVLTQHA